MEGRSREVGKSKLWRLTAEGRRLAGVDRAPVPLNSMKVDHILSVGDFYQSVQETLEGWQYEPRFEFAHGVYCPDALFKMKDRGFALEVQRSPLSSQRWAAKWAVASAFFDTLKVKPTILVLSNQSPETINCGSFLKIIIKRLDNVRE